MGYFEGYSLLEGAYETFKDISWLLTYELVFDLLHQ